MWLWSLGWEDLLKEGMATPLEHPCLENPMDRGTWWAAVHWVLKSGTWPKWLSSSSRGLFNRSDALHSICVFRNWENYPGWLLPHGVCWLWSKNQSSFDILLSLWLVDELGGLDINIRVKGFPFTWHSYLMKSPQILLWRPREKVHRWTCAVKAGQGPLKSENGWGVAI